MQTIRLRCLCLLGGLLANSGPVQGQGRDHLAPAPFRQPGPQALLHDSAALDRNPDRMPILKPDLSQLARMPVLKIDSLNRFPMPQLQVPGPRPYYFEKRNDAKKPDQ
jgi:hypothetical protein